MKVDKFKTFLANSGAQVLKPTNEYELVRFKTVNGVSIIYTSKRGLTFTGEAEEAYRRFEKKNIWQIKRKDLQALERVKEAILDRDGPACFYCGKDTVDGEDRSVEHLLSIAHGGNNNIANLVFAHAACNQAVGSMPIIEKIRYRETLRGCK